MTRCEARLRSRAAACGGAVLAWLLAAALGAAPAVAGELLLTIPNPDPQPGDYFGARVAAAANRPVVSAWYHDVGGRADVGVAYVYQPGSATSPLTLPNPTPEAGDEFGVSLAADADYVVVGAYQDNTYASNAGSVYVFDPSNGNLLHTINNPDREGGARFGSAVAVSGTKVLVGAYQADGGVGAAYLFDLSTWPTSGQYSKFANPTPASKDYFGSHVAFVGSNLLIGAHEDDDEAGLDDAGAAYLFNPTIPGNPLHVFVRPAPAAGDRFGSAVAGTCDGLLIGAYNADLAGQHNAGAAYLFQASVPWSLRQAFDNPVPANEDFGVAVEAYGCDALVGSPRQAGGGAAYLLSADSGESVDTFLNPTGIAGEDFSRSVAALGGNVLIGASSAGGGVGAAYVFTPEPATLCLLGLPGLAILLRRR